MDKVENSTAVRVKSSFSIENILSRPDNNDYQRKLQRQNPFHNNHVLFNNQVPNNYLMNDSLDLSRNEMKYEDKVCDREDQIDTDESEIASDDGNASNHSEC